MKRVYVYYLLVSLLKIGFLNGLKSITEIVTNNGYPIESYEIETQDGYILTNYRIPHGRSNSANCTHKRPVLVMHGLLSSSESYVVTKSGLGYILADNCYDVWLCNARGNYHSRKHRILDADRDSDFWSFSWHEIGFYDIPASIDHILKVTNEDKLHAVGFSQGSTALLVALSEHPEYNEKIRGIIAFAPPVYFAVRRPILLHTIGALFVRFDSLVDHLKLYEVIPLISTRNLDRLGEFICSVYNPFANICRAILSMVSKVPEDQIEEGAFSLIAATHPSGGSMKQIAHFLQIAMSGIFQQYNWGLFGNLRRYGTISPPEYNLKNVLTSVAIFYADTDHAVAPQGIFRLANTLPNVVELYKVDYQNWTHVDFVWAKDVYTLLYKRVLDVMITFDDK